MGVEEQVAEQSMEQNQALIRECHHHRQELRHLHALTRIKAEEREQKSRELLKAQVQYSTVLSHASDRMNMKPASS